MIKIKKNKLFKKLDVFDQHKLRIALDTLRMPDAMIGIFGGMTKEEALEVVKELKPKLRRI